jgi:hypothetical protein
MMINTRKKQQLPNSNNDIDMEDIEDINHITDDYQENDNIGFDSGYSDSISPHEKHNDLFRDLTNFDPFLKKQIAEWLGMYWSEAEGKYLRDTNVEPVMNIHGARWCVNCLRTYARNNNLITQLDKKTYNELYLDIVETVYLNIGTRTKEFGIRKLGDIKLVCEQVLHSSVLILIGAGGTNNYKDMFTKTTSRSESVSLNPNGTLQQPDYKKPGFMNRAKSLIFGRG